MEVCDKCRKEFDLERDYGGRCVDGYVNGEKKRLVLCGCCAEDTSMIWGNGYPVVIDE